MERDSLELPDVTIDLAQRIRFAIVAVLVAFAVLRVVPDLVRIAYPLNVFGYVTDASGTVDWVSPQPPIPARDLVRVGDRIVVGRIPPFDRKPGIVGTGYSRDNPVRILPIERNHRIYPYRPGSRRENVQARATTVLRVLAFMASLGLAAMLFLLRPGVATAAIFFYCLGADAPTTYAEIVLDNPWQQIPIWAADIFHGCGRPALLAFALSLVFPRARAARYIAIVCATAGLVLGNLNAYVDWLATYAGTPKPYLYDLYVHASSLLTAVAVVAFAAAIVAGRPRDRRRIGWIAVSFALAGIARLVSDTQYPAHITPWQNGLLLTATVLPIVSVWYSVLRHRFFNIDFVVGRAIVYVALSGAMLGLLTLGEEVGTYVFYQNTDLAYGFIIIISTLIGAASGKIVEIVEKLVDKFVFRDRHERRKALEYMSGYVLDAEHEDDVYRVLLEDVAHGLSLHFAGVLVRDGTGAFKLDREYRWPSDFAREIPETDEIVRSISSTRSPLEFDGKRRAKRLAADLSPRLSLAAPLFADRNIVALVAYGRNISGLNLNSDERERLTRLVAHASLALASIELANARAALALMPDALVTVESRAPKRVGE